MVFVVQINQRQMAERTLDKKKNAEIFIFRCMIWSKMEQIGTKFRYAAINWDWDSFLVFI